MSGSESTQEERQAWDLYFTEAVANIYRIRAAYANSKSQFKKLDDEEMLQGCAEKADKMLELRRERFK